MPMPHANERASSAVVHRPSPPPLASRHSLGALPFDRESLEIAVMLRHSAPTLARTNSPPLTAKDAPESILMRTDLHVKGVEARDGHCVYALEVDTGFGVHHLRKRYSEIRDFRTELLATVDEKKHCNHGPCSLIAQLSQIKFPRRRLRLPGRKRDPNLEVAKQRLPLLERFLQAMLRVYRMATRRQIRVCTNSHCVMLGKIKRFLNVSEPVFVEQDAVTVTPESATTPVPSPVVVAPSKLPRNFPDLAFTTLCGDKPASLFPIAEDPEHVHE